MTSLGVRLCSPRNLAHPASVLHSDLTQAGSCFRSRSRSFWTSSSLTSLTMPWLCICCRMRVRLTSRRAARRSKVFPGGQAQRLQRGHLHFDLQIAPQQHIAIDNGDYAVQHYRLLPRRRIFEGRICRGRSLRRRRGDAPPQTSLPPASGRSPALSPRASSETCPMLKKNLK